MDHFERLQYLHRGTEKKSGSKTDVKKERKSKDDRGADPGKDLSG